MLWFLTALHRVNKYCWLVLIFHGESKHDNTTLWRHHGGLTQQHRRSTRSAMKSSLWRRTISSEGKKKKKLSESVTQPYQCEHLQIVTLQAGHHLRPRGLQITDFCEHRHENQTQWRAVVAQIERTLTFTQKDRRKQFVKPNLTEGTLIIVPPTAKGDNSALSLTSRVKTRGCEWCQGLYVKVPWGILWPPDPVSCLYPVDQSLCHKTHLDPFKLKCLRDRGTQTPN